MRKERKEISPTLAKYWLLSWQYECISSVVGHCREKKRDRKWRRREKARGREEEGRVGVKGAGKGKRREGATSSLKASTLSRH